MIARNYVPLSAEILNAISASIDAALAGDGFDGGDFDGMDPEHFEQASSWVEQAVANRSDANWQPIETAPTDGTWVFVYWPTMPITLYPMVAFNCGDEYGWDTPADYGQVFPTHWMPLPPAPTPQDGDNEQ